MAHVAPAVPTPMAFGVGTAPYTFPFFTLYISLYTMQCAGPGLLCNDLY